MKKKIKNLRILRKKKERLTLLWKRYCLARNDLFNYYWGWTKKVAKIITSSNKIKYDDIETDIAICLIKALDDSNKRISYDGDDSEFKRYTLESIKTSIVDGIKLNRGVSHNLASKMKDVVTATNTNINGERLQRIKDEAKTITDYVNKLQPFEKNLMYRRYFLGEKLSDISKDVGYTSSYLSAICHCIIDKLVEETGVGPVT